METFGILFGVVFWPTALVAWIIICRKRNVRRRVRYVVFGILIGLPLFCAYSLGRWMLVDEPLAIAAMDGNVAEVRRLLRLGGDPNVEFEGNPALEQAAGGGHTEVVRLLLARGARVDVRNGWDGNTPLRSARANNHRDIVELLRKAGAKK